MQQTANFANKTLTLSAVISSVARIAIAGAIVAICIWRAFRSTCTGGNNWLRMKTQLEVQQAQKLLKHLWQYKALTGVIEVTAVRERPRSSKCPVLTDLIFTVLASEVIGTGAGTILCLIVTAIASIHTETGCWTEENKHGH